MEGYRLIDPPVGPYSPPSVIQAWITELERMQPRDGQVVEAIQQAQGWLEGAQRWWAETKAEHADKVGQR